nr:adropin isoform X1 [Macaca fascicularis]
MVREPGLGPPIEWRQRRGDGSAPRPQAAGLQRGGALRCFCWRPSPAERSRAQPSPAERSRAQPNPAQLPPPPPERCRAREQPRPRRRCGPKGRRCLLAADRPRQRPPRSRRGGSGRRRLRGRGGGPGERTSPLLVSHLPPPPARRLPSLSRRRASRCPGPSRGRAPGSTQAQDCR